MTQTNLSDKSLEPGILDAAAQHIMFTSAANVCQDEHYSTETHEVSMVLA